MAFADAVSPLAFWRKRAGLTQGALAERIGVAQNYLSDVESSKRTGRIGLWLKLSAALGVPVEALVPRIGYGRRNALSPKTANSSVNSGRSGRI